MKDSTGGFKRRRQQFTRRLNTALVKLGVVIGRTAKSESFDALLARRLAAVRRERGQFFFLQIGANDGVSHDPINAFVTANRVAGLVVEPLPDVFAALCETYARQPQIRPVNTAIHNDAESVTLYRPKASSKAGTGIASLDPDHLMLTSRRTGLQAEDMEAVEVPAVSLTGLLEREDVAHLDLLQIDTEGYDMQILASLDLDRWRPSIIRFEHGVYSGSATREALRETLLRLYDHGYSIAMERVDAVAWMHADIAKRKANQELSS